MGFVRRFSFIPSLDVINQIEGVVIADLPPPGTPTGVSTGVVLCVGEFADMTYGVHVDSNGVVTTKTQVVEVFSDMTPFGGGWDSTLGDFGGDDGNGWFFWKNKAWTRFMIAPVNLCSGVGVRLYRQLPLCAGQTNTLPVVPVVGASVAAGTEFTYTGGGGLARIRTGAQVNFTALNPITTGVAGVIVTSGTPAAFQPFTVAGADFTAVVRPDGSTGIKKGDVIVIGNNNSGALQPLPAGGDIGAGTYRVHADASSGSPTILQLEQFTGQNFDFVAATTIPYRIHVSSDADSAPVTVVGNSFPGGYAAAENGGYTIPARPLTDSAGAQTATAWTNAAVLNPKVVPTALTGSSAAPLSGLGMVLQNGTGFIYTAAVQEPNQTQNATLDALYQAALPATIGLSYPYSDIDIVCCARTSSAIRAALKAHELFASARGQGRIAIVREALSQQTLTVALGDSDPGVGANRDEGTIHTWPGIMTSVPEAVGTPVKTAVGTVTTDGNLDGGSDAWLASIMSNLSPEKNPGQSQPPVPQIMALAIGLQRGAPTLGMDEYIALKSRGICAPIDDPQLGMVFESGVTTSLNTNETTIRRKRMEYYIGDSLAKIAGPFAKAVKNTSNKDNSTGEVDGFLNGLLSPDFPAQATIAGYSVDDQSGNTKQIASTGAYFILVSVQTLGTMDTIVFGLTVGDNVTITPGGFSQAA